jgi:hypothetical protein
MRVRKDWPQFTNTLVIYPIFGTIPIEVIVALCQVITVTAVRVITKLRIPDLPFLGSGVSWTLESCHESIHIPYVSG